MTFRKVRYPSEWHALMQRHRDLIEAWAIHGPGGYDRDDLVRVRRLLDQHYMVVRFFRWLLREGGAR